MSDKQHFLDDLSGLLALLRKEGVTAYRGPTSYGKDHHGEPFAGIQLELGPPLLDAPERAAAADPEDEDDAIGPDGLTKKQRKQWFREGG